MDGNVECSSRGSMAASVDLSWPALGLALTGAYPPENEVSGAAMQASREPIGMKTQVSPCVNLRLSTPAGSRVERARDAWHAVSYRARGVLSGMRRKRSQADCTGVLGVPLKRPIYGSRTR